MSDYKDGDFKDGDRVAIPVVVLDVWDGVERKLPHREGPQVEWEFAGGVEAGDPYIEIGVAEYGVVAPWPDAERMALLEAVARAAERVVVVDDITEHLETDDGYSCAALGTYVQDPPDFKPRRLPPRKCNCGAQQVIDLAAALADLRQAVGKGST